MAEKSHKAIDKICTKRKKLLRKRQITKNGKKESTQTKKNQ